MLKQMSNVIENHQELAMQERAEMKEKQDEENRVVGTKLLFGYTYEKKIDL